MIAGWMQSPEVIFQPEGGMNEGIVLRYRSGFEPDLPQPVQAAQGFVLDDVGVIVPNKTSGQRRQVREQGQRGQRQPQPSTPTRKAGTRREPRRRRDN